MKYFYAIILGWFITGIWTVSVFADNNYSINFDKNSSQYAYITDGDQTGLDITGDLTIEGWFKIDNLDNHRALVSKYESGGNISFILSWLSNNRIRFAISSNGSTVAFKDINFTPTIDTWYHIASVYDASTGSVEFFVDGASLGTGTGLPTSIHNGNANFEIGGATNISQYMSGNVNSVRIWNVTRSESEIFNNMETELLSGSGLVSAWYSSNNDHLDLVGSNDLTAVNSPIFVEDVPYGNTPETPTSTIIIEDGTILKNYLDNYGIQFTYIFIGIFGITLGGVFIRLYKYIREWYTKYTF